MIQRNEFKATYSNSGLWIYNTALAKVIFIIQDCIEYLHHPEVEWYDDEKEKSYSGYNEDEYITDLDEMEWWQLDEFLNHNWDLHCDNADTDEEILTTELFEEIPQEFRKTDLHKEPNQADKPNEPLDLDSWKQDHKGWVEA